MKYHEKNMRKMGLKNITLACDTDSKKSKVKHREMVLTVLCEWIREQGYYVMVIPLNSGKTFLKCTKHQSPEWTRTITAKVRALSKSAKHTSWHRISTFKEVTKCRVFKINMLALRIMVMFIILVNI